MGMFTFNGSISGNPVADYMLGDVYQFWQGGGEYKELRENRLGFFGQDNFRVTSKLTLNLGLRWDPMLPPQETSAGSSASSRACNPPGSRMPRSATCCRRCRMPERRIQFVYARTGAARGFCLPLRTADGDPRRFRPVLEPAGDERVQHIRGFGAV